MTETAERRTDPVGYRVEGGAAILTLDSPANRNALSTALVTGLLDGFAAAAADPDVRVVVLSHTGKTFCAGADLREVGATPALRTEQMVRLLRAILELPKAVIGRIDGHVRAGGMGLVGACDIVVAGPNATFGLTESRIGVSPAIISLTLLPVLDPRAAGRYFLTGESFDAREARRIGLITEAVDDTEKEVDRLITEFRAVSPQGMAESKKLVNAAVLDGFDERAKDLAATSARLFGTEEAAEGMLAFLQRRLPRWAAVPADAAAAAEPVAPAEPARPHGG